MTAPNIAITYTDLDNGDDDARLAGLLSFLQDEERRSFDDSLNDERAVCIDFYNGEPFGDEEDGRSQYVTRDVAEVVDQGVASLESVMLSGDSAVEFDTQDKKLGKAITAAVGKEFFQGQDGYRVLHDWIKAGLLEKTSVAKVCIEPQPPKREEMTVPAEAMVLLQQEAANNPDGPQIIAAEPVDETEEQWRIAVAIPQPPLFRDYIVPNEEMGIAQDARDLDDACEYSVYKMPKTISQIAQMGYDTEGLQSDSNDDGDTHSSRSPVASRGMVLRRWATARLSGPVMVAPASMRATCLRPLLPNPRARANASCVMPSDLRAALNSAEVISGNAPYAVNTFTQFSRLEPIRQALKASGVLDVVCRAHASLG